MKRWRTLAILLFGVTTLNAQTDNVAREDTLEGVTVMSRTAQRRLNEVQVGVERIDLGTMSKTPSLLGERDIIRSLQLLPGVKNESEASSGYQVRGGTSAQNLILLDGATIYNAGHLMGLLSTFNDNALNNAISMLLSDFSLPTYRQRVLSNRTSRRFSSPGGGHISTFSSRHRRSIRTTPSISMMPICN